MNGKCSAQKPHISVLPFIETGKNNENIIQ